MIKVIITLKEKIKMDNIHNQTDTKNNNKIKIMIKTTILTRTITKKMRPKILMRTNQT